MRPWFAHRTLADVADALDVTHVLWSPFRRLTDLADDVVQGHSAIAQVRDEPGLGSVVVTSGPQRLRGEDVPDVPAAPVLGADTDRLLRDATTSGGAG
jgi:2-methylfumaryl-CoA isomerase